MLTAAALSLALAAHAPVVVQGSHERFPLASVAAAPTTVPGIGNDRRDRVAAAAMQATEMVQLHVDDHARPVQAVYAQHSGAERCAWATVEKRRGVHPLVYAAHGSHASYLRRGVRDRTWPDPNDEADGRGTVVTPRLVRIDERSPRWMRWPGRWGGARAAWWNPAEQDSPPGPAFQGQGRWSDPDKWARDARSCRADCDELGECDWRESALGGGLLAAAGLFGGVIGLRRRRRGRR